MTNEEINDEINWVRAKSRFINSDLSRLVNLNLICFPNDSPDWNCPNCVRRAIDKLIDFQSKLNLPKNK